MYLVKVYVTLKKSVLDPQGVTVKKALNSLEFKKVKDVRLGKYVEIKIDCKSKKEAEKQTEGICKKLLVNPVIETYYYDILKASK